MGFGLLRLRSASGFLLNACQITRLLSVAEISYIGLRLRSANGFLFNACQITRLLSVAEISNAIDELANNRLSNLIGLPY